MKKLLLPLILAPLLAFALPAVPGVIVTTVNKDLVSGETWTNTMYVRGEDLAMEFADPRSGSSGSMVFLAADGEWIMNNDEDRKFVRMDREGIERLSEQMKSMMERVEQMMSRIPEAQREALMRNGGIPGMDMLAGGGIPTIEMRETGERETKAGYAAERFDMYIGDKRTQEMWITDWSNVDGADQVRTAMTGFAEMMKSFFEAMPIGMFGEGGMSSFMDFDRGIPIVTYEIGDDGNPKTEATIQSFTAGDVDPTLFGPKPGYSEQEINFN